MRPFLLSLQPFIKGFTVFYWATGTWWIPMLVVLAVWRHVFRRFPLKCDPLYWGAVFPLGRYAASTHEMIAAMGFAFLKFLPAGLSLHRTCREDGGLWRIRHGSVAPRPRISILAGRAISRRRTATWPARTNLIQVARTSPASS